MATKIFDMKDYPSISDWRANFTLTIETNGDFTFANTAGTTNDLYPQGALGNFNTISGQFPSFDFTGSNRTFAFFLQYGLSTAGTTLEYIPTTSNSAVTLNQGSNGFSSIVFYNSDQAIVTSYNFLRFSSGVTATIAEWQVWELHPSELVFGATGGVRIPNIRGGADQ